MIRLADVRCHSQLSVSYSSSSLFEIRALHLTLLTLLYNAVPYFKAYLKPCEDQFTIKEQVHGVDEPQASGEGKKEEREEPIFCHHRDARDPCTKVVLGVHLLTATSY